MSLLSMEDKSYRSSLSDALFAKSGKTVAIKSKGPFGPWDIEVDNVLKMVVSSKFEDVEAETAAGQIFDHIKPDQYFLDPIDD